MAVFFSFSFFILMHSKSSEMTTCVYKPGVDGLIVVLYKDHPQITVSRYKGIFPVIHVIGSDKRKKLGLFFVSAKLGES